MLDIKIPTKLCEECFMIAYTTKSADGHPLYFCQNPFCIKSGKQV